ncbi:hypothetical protein DMH01_03405 [Amycolatopsis sp. WAC 04182]|uniref:helix-turn-helix domain-containing protein n=1 Tax=Amycolatopsis sp. WAC 04182 TaxID=2203198 RepID=UPI000F7B40FA|nr:helix-turn-helix transcriptional regulator [Amycolatopsis sp. WAC 04182]RSN65436.1 hypothetical protein DMH01_03405 [Amycolatopsis sp. WAC 04182]
MTAPSGIGRYLAKLRVSTGLSAQEVAHRMQVVPSAVSHFERDLTDPRMSTVRRYCDAIGAHIHIRLKEAP